MSATQHRRDFIKRAGLAGAAISILGLPEGCGWGSGSPPNIVLIFTDDLGSPGPLIPDRSESRGKNAGGDPQHRTGRFLRGA